MKFCFKAGPKFKSCKGMWLIIVRAMYGPKSAGSSFRAHLASNLRTMGFKLELTDCNVWMLKNFLTLPHYSIIMREVQQGLPLLCSDRRPTLETLILSLAGPTMSTSVPGLMIC